MEQWLTRYPLSACRFNCELSQGFGDFIKVLMVFFFFFFIRKIQQDANVFQGVLARTDRYVKNRKYRLLDGTL